MTKETIQDKLMTLMTEWKYTLKTTTKVKKTFIRHFYDEVIEVQVEKKLYSVEPTEARIPFNMMADLDQLGFKRVR